MAPRTAGSLSAGARAAGAQPAQPQAAGTQLTEPRVTEGRATEGGTTEARDAGPRADTAPRPAAWVRGLTREFAGRRVLDELDLDIAPGEFVALIGRSGSGKSTLLRALAGLDRAVTGDLGVEGTAAVAFQEPRLLPWRRVWANVGLGLRTGDAKAVALDALEEVGLGARADAWPLPLSGGEAQRAALARALVREPSLLLLDEPFSALDALTTITMHRLVLRLWAHHQPAVLLVTHDVDEALSLSDRVLVLAGGQIAFSERIEVPRPRERDHPELSALRTRLLIELGVVTEG